MQSVPYFIIIIIISQWKHRVKGQQLCSTSARGMCSMSSSFCEGALRICVFCMHIFFQYSYTHTGTQTKLWTFFKLWKYQPFLNCHSSNTVSGSLPIHKQVDLIGCDFCRYQDKPIEHALVHAIVLTCVILFIRRNRLSELIEGRSYWQWVVETGGKFRLWDKCFC